MEREQEGKLGKILLVDDEKDILDVIKIWLGANEYLKGYEVLCAEDGVRALELYQEHNPDAVVLDLMLPKKGGFLVLQRMKGSITNKGKKPYVIMITGNEGHRHKVFAQSLGVDEYLNKPFRMETLMDMLQSYLETGRYVRQSAFPGLPKTEDSTGSQRTDYTPPKAYTPTPPQKKGGLVRKIKGFFKRK